MRKIIILLYITAKLLLSTAFAQTSYPLYVVPTLTPPHSLNLSDYSKFGSQNLMITVNANDLNIENLPVKLHIKIETVGITIENPPTINTTPIFINGGETNVLFGEDLEDYFNINNLIFKGYSKNTYKRTGQLPEGFYKFSIDILHYNTNRPISNIGTVTAWIALGKPPVLKLPLNNAKMGQYKGVPLSFSWLPAAVGSPVSANSIQYKFEMWEMHIPAINPNTIAATTPLFHEHTDFNTIYTLYPSTLLMTPGMKYAWRITASDISGFVPFEQNGHSEIRTFIYKAACDSVTNLTAKNRGKSALFKWESKSNHTSFNIEMQNPQTGWVNNSESFQSKAEFFDLNYGDTYKMRVQAVCDGDPNSKSDFSDWKTVTIPKPAPATDDCPECVCDDKIPDAEITNFDLRDDLQPGDTIINKTGTSRYIVKSVEPQGDGAYKGVFLFWTEIWNLKFICNYWDLQVNTDNVIVNMDFESVYDPKFLVDIDAATGYLDSLSNNISTLITDLTPKDTVNTDDSIISIYVNDGDSLIVVTVDDDGNTNEIVLSGDADDAGGTLITDDDGNEYIINNDGKPMGTGEYLNTGGGNQDKIDNYNKDKEENHLSESVTINFTQADKQKYGFDSYNNQKSALQTRYPTLKNGYRAAFKSIASFGSDIVGVSSKHSNVVYKDEMGIPCTKTGENLNIRGSTNGSDVTLYAYHTVNDTTEKVAGKLNILSFDEQAKQLYIVPVNGANVPDAKALKDVINSTYKQAITRWEVTKIDNLSDVTFKSGNMSHGGTSAISVYNKDQRTIVKRFKEVHGKLEKDAYYLFFVEGVQFKGRSIAGYMPLQRQVGFIYDNPNLNIIAHELGHGAFNLRHTFSSDNFIASEMSTQNLMDYKGGVELWKHQWKLIQSPDKLLFSWAQDEQEGEYIEEGHISEVSRFINTIKCAKIKKHKTVNIHHGFNSYNVKVGDLLKQLNKYRTSSPSIAGEEFKNTHLNIYIHEGIFSSASDLYLGYHNFELLVDEYERKPAQGINSEKLIFTANGKPIIFSFPIGTNKDTQKDILDWIERECGLKNGGSYFESINFNIESDNIKELFSLSVCQLEQLNKEDRKKLIGKTLKNVENFLGLDKDSYQYLLANLIKSTPPSDVEDLISYLSNISGDLESTFLALSPTAQEIFIQGLCEVAIKSWTETQYLGDLNSYILGLRSIQRDLQNRVRLGVCGTFNLQPGKYEFSYSIWVSDDGMFPSNDPDPRGVYEVSAFDPIECHIINDNAEFESSQIMPAIVVKLYAVNLHIANINKLLDIAKMVILPEFSGALFVGANRIGTNTVKLFKGFTNSITSATGKFLSKCGKLGYKLKKAGTEIALYTNLNIEIARFSGTGKLITKVSPNTRTGTKILHWEDDIEYVTIANKSKKGRIELVKADDGTIFFRELTSKRYIAKTGNELSTHLNNISDLPTGKTYNGDVYRSLSVSSEVDFGAIPQKMTDHNIYSSWGRYDLQGQENAMYLSKTLPGNKTELVPHYGKWNEFSTYKFSDIQANNLLDLTDDLIRQRLGTQFDDLTRILENKSDMYEFTNILASWARKKGYNGLIVPGARGAKNYENIIIFNQKYIDEILSGKTPQKIIK